MEKRKIVITKKETETLLPLTNFVMGIADLTGELMRKCISNLATGNINSCFETCKFVRCLYKGFISVQGFEECLKLIILEKLREKKKDDTDVMITIKYVLNIPRTDYHYLQFFNILMRKCLASLNLQLVGRNYFDARAKVGE